MVKKFYAHKNIERRVDDNLLEFLLKSVYVVTYVVKKLKFEESICVYNTSL